MMIGFYSSDVLALVLAIGAALLVIAGWIWKRRK